MDIMGLFPTPIAKCNFGRPLLFNELETVLAQQTKLNQGNSCSVNTFVLDLPELVELKKFINKKLQEYLGTAYTPQHPVELKITQSWFNYTNTSQYHHTHRHANSFVSGVFYIQTNEATDKIVFHREPSRELQLPSAQEHLFNAQSWWVGVNDGDLLLFPSHLHHSVNEVSGSKIRISLAFNTFPVGQIGNPNSMASLVLK